jgi:hypothetical protein
MDRTAFLAAVSKLVREASQSKEPEGLKLATLGYWIRGKLLEDWRVLGFPQLKHVVQELARSGQMRLGPDSKGALSVWSVEVSTAESPIGAPATPLPSSTTSVSNPPKFPYMRQAIWLALVSPSSVVQYLDRRTGHVQISAVGSPGADWIEMPRIDQETQRNWAREFLARHGLATDSELLAALTAIDWHVLFPQMLRQRSTLLARRWQVDRSSRVRTLAVEWCRQKGVEESLIFDPPAQASAPAPGTREENKSLSGGLRELLLEAIKRMTTEEMLQLSIPARYVVQALRPDLATPSK